MPTRYEVPQQVLSTDWAGKRFLRPVGVPHSLMPKLGRHRPGVVAMLVNPPVLQVIKDNMHQAENPTCKYNAKCTCLKNKLASSGFGVQKAQGPDLAPDPLKQAFFERKKSSFGEPWNFGILRVGFGVPGFGVLGSGSCFLWVWGPEGPGSRFGAGPFKTSIFWKEKIEFWNALKFWNS